MRYFLRNQSQVLGNLDKERGFVNGRTVTVLATKRKGILVEMSNKQTLMVYPAHDFSPTGTATGPAYYPVRLGYSTTLHKIQGATLPHITIWLDCPYVRAAAYVALSRVQYDDNWRFIGQVETKHFLPAQCLG